MLFWIWKYWHTFLDWECFHLVGLYEMNLILNCKVCMGKVYNRGNTLNSKKLLLYVSLLLFTIVIFIYLNFIRKRISNNMSPQFLHQIDKRHIRDNILNVTRYISAYKVISRSLYFNTNDYTYHPNLTWNILLTTFLLERYSFAILWKTLFSFRSYRIYTDLQKTSLPILKIIKTNQNNDL